MNLRRKNLRTREQVHQHIIKSPNYQIGHSSHLSHSSHSSHCFFVQFSGSKPISPSSNYQITKLLPVSICFRGFVVQFRSSKVQCSTFNVGSSGEKVHWHICILAHISYLGESPSAHHQIIKLAIYHIHHISSYFNSPPGEGPSAHHQITKSSNHQIDHTSHLSHSFTNFAPPKFKEIL